MVLLEECAVKRVGRTTYDESHVYSTLPGLEGYQELRTLATRIGLIRGRVKWYPPLAHLMLHAHEVQWAKDAGARVGTADELAAIRLQAMHDDSQTG